MFANYTEGLKYLEALNKAVADSVAPGITREQSRASVVAAFGDCKQLMAAMDAVSCVHIDDAQMPKTWAVEGAINVEAYTGTLVDNVMEYAKAARVPIHMEMLMWLPGYAERTDKFKAEREAKYVAAEQARSGG